VPHAGVTASGLSKGKGLLSRVREGAILTASGR
jgi:hypothetical protein